MLHQYNILIHIIAGTLALGIGIAPFVTAKGGRNHQRFGRLYLMLMSIVILTALAGVFFFRDRPFLTLITIHSSYVTFTGFRALKYKTIGPGRIELMAALVLLGVASLFVWNLQSINIVWHMSVIYYLLGFLMVILIYDFLRIFKVLQWPQAWLPEHFLKMTSSFSALFSAAAGTVLTGWEPWSQIGSSSLGTLLLIWVIWRYRKAFTAGRKAV